MKRIRMHRRLVQYGTLKYCRRCGFTSRYGIYTRQCATVACDGRLWWLDDPDVDIPGIHRKVVIMPSAQLRILMTATRNMSNSLRGGVCDIDATLQALADILCRDALPSPDDITGQTKGTEGDAR